MLTFNYLNQLKIDVMRWQQSGLIRAEQSDLLLLDAENHRPKKSFGTVVALLGAALITFGIIAFVASNWKSMGEMFRFGTVLVFLVLAYVIAGFFHYKKFYALTHAFTVIAIAAFGGGIMLVGQIFHLQGSTADAMLLWLGGAVLTAIATRSYAAVFAMVAILMIWIGYEFGADAHYKTFLGLQRYYWFPAIWIIGAALAHWVSSRIAAHLLSIAMIFWLFMLVNKTSFSTTWVICISYVVLSLSLASYSTKHYLKGFEIPLISYTVTVILASVPISNLFGLLGRNRVAESTFINNYLPIAIAFVFTGALVFYLRAKRVELLRDQYVIPIALILSSIVTFRLFEMSADLWSILTAAVGLFMAIWIVRFSWRIESRTLSGIGYAFFVYLLFETYRSLFGSLEMTALVYAIAGFGLLALSVWLINREKHDTSLGADDA